MNGESGFRITCNHNYILPLTDYLLSVRLYTKHLIDDISPILTEVLCDVGSKVLIFPFHR